MNDERRSEILKAAVSGLNTAEIASVEDLPVDQVEQIIADGAEEMAAIRQHMQSMGWREED